MPLRNQKVVTFTPRGVTDSVDGTNAAAGGNRSPSDMMAASDIVPSMHTPRVWVPRPGAFKLLDFSTFTGPITGEALIEIGDRVYGMVASARNPGRSEPFVYDFTTNTFVPVQGVSASNTPLSAPTAGDWQPPTIQQVGAYTLFTHPGFQLPNAFGWIDQTGFTDTATGQTGFGPLPGVWGSGLWGMMHWGGPQPAGGVGIANLSKNVLQAGWRPGMLIRDSAGQIPPGTRIQAIAPDGLSLVMTATTTGPTVVNDNLTVNGGTPANPLWAAGNTSINPLLAPPVAVNLFNGRAEYAVNTAEGSGFAMTAAVAFSDAGDPLIRSLPTPEVVTLQNGLPITALATIPFNNATVIGGIVEALLVFQGDAGIWQITGDPGTNNLALNFLSPLGTLAPLTLASSPTGLKFVAPDGTRQINLDGTVSEPWAANGQGVAQPFINAQYPSRMCAAYNEDVYRISVTGETSIGGSVIPNVVAAEYWFHEKLRAWSGPHSFPAKLITPSNRAATNHGFLMFPLPAAGGSVPGGAIEIAPSGGIVLDSHGAIVLTGSAGSLPEIWFSNTRPLIDSRYTENGKAMSWAYQTTLLPDTLTMFMNAVVQTNLFIALAPPAGVGSSGNPGSSAVITALDEEGATIDQVTIAGFLPSTTQLPVAPPGLWGTMVWGKSLWGSLTGGAVLTQRDIPWSDKLLFKQMVVLVTGASGPNVAIGNLYLRYQQLGYSLADPRQVALGGQAGVGLGA